MTYSTKILNKYITLENNSTQYAFCVYDEKAVKKVSVYVSNEDYNNYNIGDVISIDVKEVENRFLPINKHIERTFE